MCYDSLKQELNKSFPQTPPEIRSMIGQEVARQMDNKKTAFSKRQKKHPDTNIPVMRIFITNFSFKVNHILASSILIYEKYQ